jgi:hypothetical protein
MNERPQHLPVDGEEELDGAEMPERSCHLDPGPAMGRLVP